MKTQKTMSCTTARRRMQAFHDGELPMGDQVAMSAHLADCENCAATLGELEQVGALLRRSAPARERIENFDEVAFQQAVVSRVVAEQRVSLPARLQDMFEDMRLVYAGLGASIAAVACILMMLNVMRSVKDDRNPESLAGKVRMMASIEAGQASGGGLPKITPVLEARLLPQTASGATYAADSDADVVLNGADVEFGIRGVITRQGQVEALELVRVSTGTAIGSGTAEARALRNLMVGIARQRYEPARVDGLPVAVNKMWLIRHTTVHGTKPEDVAVQPSLASKKRLTSTTANLSTLPA